MTRRIARWCVSGCLAAGAVGAGGDEPEAVVWSVETKAPCYGSGAAADLDGDGRHEIVFGTYFNDEHLYILNAEDGSLVTKRRSAGGPLDASVLLHDVNTDGTLDIVYADSAYGTVFCIDVNGNETWRFDAQSGTDSPFAAADLDGDGDVELVYGTMISVSDRDKGGHVNVLDGKTGELVWTQRVPGHVQSEPALVDVNDDGVLDALVTNWFGDGKLRALDGRKGALLWTFDTNDSVYHGVTIIPATEDDALGIIVTDRAGNVSRLTKHGKSVWTASLRGESPGTVFAPTTRIGDDRVVVCGRHVHLLDAQTGKLVWERRFSGGSISRGGVWCDLHDDGVPDIIVAHRNRLLGLDGRHGKTTFELDLTIKGDPYESHDNAPLLLDADGDGWLEAFIVGGRGLSNETKGENYGRAVMVRLPKAPAQRHEWTTFRGGPKRTGQRER